jgi:hypothetical protein
MASVFDKLNLGDRTEVVVLDAPASLEPELALLKGVVVQRSLKNVDAVGFSLAFVTKQKELDAMAGAVAKKAKGDALVWFAYPKGTSKRYTCEFNRDTGWHVLGQNGFEAVRQVAIDEDWSALRFRRVEFIKSMARACKRAMTRAAKTRSTKKA